MHERDLRVLTASKDYTVGVSQITEGNLAVVRSYDICQNIVKTVTPNQQNNHPKIDQNSKPTHHTGPLAPDRRYPHGVCGGRQ